MIALLWERRSIGCDEEGRWHCVAYIPEPLVMRSTISIAISRLFFGVLSCGIILLPTMATAQQADAEVPNLDKISSGLRRTCSS